MIVTLPLPTNLISLRILDRTRNLTLPSTPPLQHQGKSLNTDERFGGYDGEGPVPTGELRILREGFYKWLQLGDGHATTNPVIFIRALNQA